MEKLELKLDFRNKKALSSQVQDEIRQYIRTGILQPGDQLPTVRELADQSNINFNTVARAYRVLDQEGWITTRQGRGTYVLDRIETENDKAELSRAQIIQQLIEGLLADAKRMGIAPEELREVLDQIAATDSRMKLKQPRKKIRTIQKKPTHIIVWNPNWGINAEGQKRSLLKGRRGRGREWRKKY